LTAWTKFGAFASLAWVIGGGLWTHNHPPLSPQWEFYNYTCARGGLSSPLTDSEKKNCATSRSRIEANGATDNLVRIVFTVAIPITVGWLLFMLASWAVVGFRQPR